MSTGKKNHLKVRVIFIGPSPSLTLFRVLNLTVRMLQDLNWTKPGRSAGTPGNSLREAGYQWPSSKPRMSSPSYFVVKQTVETDCYSDLETGTFLAPNKKMNLVGKKKQIKMN